MEFHHRSKTYRQQHLQTLVGSMTTPYHSVYFAHELTRRQTANGVDRLSRALFDACVDLNPHQVDAALFALRSPLARGALLADEVGLGKTIEAGLVLCQFWAERRRRLLVVCPASLRKQWAMELEEKFNLPTLILENSQFRQMQANGLQNPFDGQSVGDASVIITSLHFASRMRDWVRQTQWDLVVIDEAHKLRNAYRKSNKMGQNLSWALEDTRKLLLTATPLQNSLLELYGLTSLIDDQIFGELAAFRARYTNQDADLEDLRQRLSPFCHRTLRRQVLEYVQYTERRPMTREFFPSDAEQSLYESVSAFLDRDDTYSIPSRQRHLTTLILRKILASSSYALAGTMDTFRERLEGLLQDRREALSLAERIIEGEELEPDLLDEWSEEPAFSLQDELEDDAGHDEESLDSDGNGNGSQNGTPAIDLNRLRREIEELERFAGWARGIQVDEKSRALLQALRIGLDEMARMGAPRKALIFTESRRTQDYLKRFLEANGYAGRIVLFSGTNSDPDSRAIYEQWQERHRADGRASGVRDVDMRTALIEHFRDHADIMIATEAGAEGVNLQFCALVVNYDLPWNPQRIEQRIGRCHRYGQHFDVVVINFLNQRNEADQRVYELLRDKFNLFSGIFGASDEVLGSVESGVDFERRVLAIYQTCRTPQEIEAAFQALRDELQARIDDRMAATRRKLLEYFDEDVHARLRGQLADTRFQLDRVARMFWRLTRNLLAGKAVFDDQELAFDLLRPPDPEIAPGHYRLISKTRENVPGTFLYRLSHPLGEYVIDAGKSLAPPPAQVTFDITRHPTRISVVEALRGCSGWLLLQLLTIDAFGRDEYLLFSAFTDSGEAVDQETCERLFSCDAALSPMAEVPGPIVNRLQAEATRHAQATLHRNMEANSRFFREEQERLERWAEDVMLAAERALQETKAQIKVLSRQARQASTTQEQHELQQRIRELEAKQRSQRRRIFEVEDEIMQKRDALIDALEQRMTQRTHRQTLFTIRWQVI